jgi:hypothetical protein
MLTFGPLPRKMVRTVEDGFRHAEVAASTVPLLGECAPERLAEKLPTKVPSYVVRSVRQSRSAFQFQPKRPGGAVPRRTG